MYITNCDNPIAKKLLKSNINAKNNNTIAEPLKEPYKQRHTPPTFRVNKHLKSLTVIYCKFR